MRLLNLPTLGDYGANNNYFSGGVTKRAPHFLDTTSLCTSFRSPGTREGELGGPLIFIRMCKPPLFFGVPAHHWVTRGPQIEGF